jgi:hypothetical protein
LISTRLWKFQWPPIQLVCIERFLKLHKYLKVPPIRHGKLVRVSEVLLIFEEMVIVIEIARFGGLNFVLGDLV